MLNRMTLTQWLASRRLAKLRRPDSEYRARRLAQFDSARRERYAENIRRAGL